MSTPRHDQPADSIASEAIIKIQLRNALSSQELASLARRAAESNQTFSEWLVDHLRRVAATAAIH